MKESDFSHRTPRVRIPRTEKVTAEELARRSKAVDRVLEVRHKIGRIGLPVDELVHETRKERGCD